MYIRFFKRFFDFILSFLGILVLSPILLFFIIVGGISMKGNPFFLQERVGLNDKVFKIIKFRTMNNKKDENGELLPDKERTSKYGAFLRNTSIDELPELFNIFFGDMAIVGPRPLLVSYLPLYSEEERHRHDTRPGLTGLAQVNGRNGISWEEKFAYDLEYVQKISIGNDIKIIIKTIGVVLGSDGIDASAEETMEDFKGHNN